MIRNKARFHTPTTKPIFTPLSYRGFTLIEIMVVLAIFWTWGTTSEESLSGASAVTKNLSDLTNQRL